MPFEQAPPELPHVDLSSEDLKLHLDNISQGYALSLVTETFNKYETDRNTNHDFRWNNNDTLYWGWVPPKVWEGTNIPRVSLGQPLVFDQIEAALPAINQSLFSGGGEDWFQCVPEVGAEPADSRQIQAALNYSLDHNRDESGMTARSEVEQLANKQLLLYGNGGVVLEWDSERMQPVVQWIDIRDLYVDFSCPTPNIEEARSVVRRRMMTVDEVDSLRDSPGMMIPSKAVLSWLSTNAPFATADRTKQVQEAFRGVNYSPTTSDWSPMPSQRKIEVLVYYSKSRIVWVLNRKWVAYNGKNPYGFYPFAIAPCYIVPGRFYAQSVADVQEGNQRYIESLMNNHLDEISLMLHPPRVIARNNFLTPSQQKWRPGGVYSLDSAEDMALLAPPGGTMNIFPEIDYLERLAERRTGINSMGMGVPRPGNVNRTKFGVQAQLEGGANRLNTVVRNIEDYMIVPMLKKMYEMFRYHVMPGAAVPAIQATSPSTFFINSDIFQKPVNFKMLASSRMVTQQKLAAMFPFISQFLLSGQFMSAINGTGKTVDFDELFRMMKDSTGTGSIYTFVRDMTEEEKEARKQPPPEVVAEKERSQQEAQVRLQMGQMKQQSEMTKAQVDWQKALLQQQPPPPDPSKQQEAQMKLQLQAILGKMKIEQAQQEMIMRQVEQAQTLKMKQEEMRIKMAENQLKQRSTVAQTQTNLAANRATQTLKLQQMVEEAQIKAQTLRQQQKQVGASEGKRGPRK